MTPETIYEAAFRSLDFEPTPDQQSLLVALSRFVVNHRPRQVFVLNGYAGTGKTSVIAAIVKAMKRVRAPFALLSPTGRAAKVASGFSGVKTSTIHRRLFRPMSADPSERRYILARNDSRDTVFFIDEASMITHKSEGRGSLLLQLTQYVLSGDNCAMVLIGDTAQLPPVGETSAPAMNPEVLRSIGLAPYLFTLTEPMRQAADSGILANATAVRRLLDAPAPPKFILKGYDDVKVVTNAELADELSSSWAAVGQEQTLIITRSNRRANACNRDVRARVLYADEALARGERLVIAKNDYYWGMVNKNRDLIANGETAIVEWAGSAEHRYGFSFVEAELRLPSDDALVACKLIIDSLTAEGPGLTRDAMQRLYDSIGREISVSEAFSGSETVDNPLGGDSVSGGVSMALDRKIQNNPYFNAIQSKYAYCVTCHKAQGGQWKHVYIDLNSIPAEAFSTPDFHRWLYTAITRASERLYLILPRNPDDDF